MDLFNGYVWTGERSLELGLVDALGSADFIAREVVKADTLVDFTTKESVFEQVGRRFGSQLGASLKQSLLNRW